MDTFTNYADISITQILFCDVHLFPFNFLISMVQVYKQEPPCQRSLVPITSYVPQGSRQHRHFSTKLTKKQVLGREEEGFSWVVVLNHSLDLKYLETCFIMSSLVMGIRMKLLL